MSRIHEEIARELSSGPSPDKALDLKDIERRRLIPTLLTCWNVYKRMVYGAGPLPTIQEDECRRAFFAGMAEMVKVFTQLPSEVEVIERVMRTIETELKRVPALEFPEVLHAPDLFLGRGQ